MDINIECKRWGGGGGGVVLYCLPNGPNPEHQKCFFIRKQLIGSILVLAIAMVALCSFTMAMLSQVFCMVFFFCCCSFLKIRFDIEKIAHMQIKTFLWKTGFNRLKWKEKTNEGSIRTRRYCKSVFHFSKCF